MATRLLQTHEVSDICIGKPALRWLPPSSTVADAIAELEGGGSRGPDAAVFVWDGEGAVAGRVCMADVLLFLCAGNNVASPAAALQASLSDLLDAGAPPVRRIEPDARSRHVFRLFPGTPRVRHLTELIHLGSVLEAVDAFLDGAHSLVVPIADRRRAAAGQLCWLTVEDLVRFFVGSIGLFSPTASLSVSQLGIVRPATFAVAPGDWALSAVPLLRSALSSHSSVAVTTGAGFRRRLVGEVSPSTLCSCDLSVAAAIFALSAGDLMAFVQCGAATPSATLNDLRCRPRLRLMARREESYRIFELWRWHAHGWHQHKLVLFIALGNARFRLGSMNDTRGPLMILAANADVATCTGLSRRR
ncbi:hypothetical protein ABZP36_004378 [Zizania latifolia]